MINLLQLLFGFIFKHAVGFVVIIVVLMAGAFAQKEFAKHNETAGVVQDVDRGKVDLLKFILDKEKEVSARINSLGKLPLKVLKQQIDTLDKEIKRRSADRSPRGLTLCVLRGGASCDRYFHELKAAAELSLLEQERHYLNSVYTIAIDKDARVFGEQELERLRERHVLTNSALKAKEDEKARFMESRRIIDRLNPWSQNSQELKEIKREIRELQGNNQRAYEAWARQKKILDTLNIPKVLKKFEVHRDQLNSELQNLTNEIDELKSNYKDNWITKIEEMTLPFVPMALTILLSIIFLPVAIKAFLYFVVAPLATSRAPLRLLPNSAKNEEVTQDDPNSAKNEEVTQDDPNLDASGVKISAVSQPITIDQTQELLVHPEYLQSTAHRGEKDTKWLLDYSYPLSSLAAGMYGLTRIRTPATDLVVISSTADQFSEVGVITLKHNSAFVFQPHNLIGIVQSRNHPLEITRHWRLGSLQAWLTLQLRFLVFHGPVRLIVTGRRGIRVERSGTGRSISQAATIGFSANLGYSTTRCETFGSYLMGKRELFNDKFSGGPGYYVYEETPVLGKKSGITGRGLEGIFDSFLKIFGI